MREAGPVIWSRNSNAWVVTRHQDTVDAYRGACPLERPVPARLCGGAGGRARRAFSTDDAHDRLLAGLHGSSAAYALEELLTRSFGRKVIEDLRPYVRQTVRAVLDRAGDQR